MSTYRRYRHRVAAALLALGITSSAVLVLTLAFNLDRTIGTSAPPLLNTVSRIAGLGQLIAQATSASLALNRYSESGNVEFLKPVRMELYKLQASVASILESPGDNSGLSRELASVHETLSGAIGHVEVALANPASGLLTVQSGRTTHEQTSISALAATVSRLSELLDVEYKSISVSGRAGLQTNPLSYAWVLPLLLALVAILSARALLRSREDAAKTPAIAVGSSIRKPEISAYVPQVRASAASQTEFAEPNRLTAQFEKIVAHSLRKGFSAGILHVELEPGKASRAKTGSAYSKRLFAEFAGEIEAKFRTEHCVARINDTEFLVIASAVHGRDTFRMLEQLVWEAARRLKAENFDSADMTFKVISAVYGMDGYSLPDLMKSHQRPSAPPAPILTVVETIEPLRPAPEAPAPDPVPPPAQAADIICATPQLAFTVDCDPVSSSLMGAEFQSFGWTVHRMNRADDALRLMEQLGAGHPGLSVSPVLYVDEDQLETPLHLFAERLRRIAPNLWLVAATAQLTHPPLDRCCFVPKPFDRSDLLSALFASGPARLIDALPGVAYLADDKGILCNVGRPASRQAGEPAPGVDSSAVGKSLFEFIIGGPVRCTAKQLHRHVANHPGAAISYPYRCDAANVRRAMRMKMRHVCDADGASLVLYQSMIVSEATRAPINLFETGSRNAAHPMTRVDMCSYCHDVRDASAAGAGDLWQSVEVFYQHRVRSTGVRHNVCPGCSQRLLKLTAKQESIAA